MVLESAMPQFKSWLPAYYLWELEETQHLFKPQFIQLRNGGNKSWLIRLLCKLNKNESVLWQGGFSLLVSSGSIPKQALGLAVWLVKLLPILTSAPFLLDRVGLEWGCGWHLNLYFYKNKNVKNLFCRFQLEPSPFTFLTFIQPPLKAWFGFGQDPWG